MAYARHRSAMQQGMDVVVPVAGEPPSSPVPLAHPLRDLRLSNDSNSASDDEHFNTRAQVRQHEARMESANLPACCDKRQPAVDNMDCDVASPRDQPQQPCHGDLGFAVAARSAQDCSPVLWKMPQSSEHPTIAAGSQASSAPCSDGGGSVLLCNAGQDPIRLDSAPAESDAVQVANPESCTTPPPFSPPAMHHTSAFMNSPVWHLSSVIDGRAVNELTPSTQPTASASIVAADANMEASASGQEDRLPGDRPCQLQLEPSQAAPLHQQATTALSSDGDCSHGGPDDQQDDAVLAGPSMAPLDATGQAPLLDEGLATQALEAGADSEVAELRARLARVEASRDELARQQGQYKGMIARLEGVVSSNERRLKLQASELEQAKASSKQMRTDLQAARIALTVTPERCRASLKALQDESSRALGTVAEHGDLVRQLTDLLEHEEREAFELQDFYQEERSTLLQQSQEQQSLLVAERQAASQLQAALQQEQGRTAQLQSDQNRLQGEAYHAKERVVDLQAEVMHLQQQLTQLQQSEAAARSAAVTGVEGQARAERELAEVKEMGLRMFKQMRGIVHALEKQSATLASRAPEVVVMVKSLQEWMSRHQHTAQVWAAGGSLEEQTMSLAQMAAAMGAAEGVAPGM